ncbi:Arabinose 5-phosphate isomerase KdsD [Serratia symbiotica]|nr:Arabinose 5-phosphate isomerase KdsD [Serratia symbiotica]
MSDFKLQSKFDFQKIGKEVIQIECEGLAQIDRYININFTYACEIIASCSGKVIVMGMGKSGHIGCKIASTFASTGTSSFFVHPADASHGDLGMVTSQDVVFAISNSGESNEILALVPILKHKNIKLICMTNNPESTMGKIADIHLQIKVPKEACPFGLAPTTSTTASLIMGDALAIALLKSREFTLKDFALSHPGGTLGRQCLLLVNDIMHTGSKIPYVNINASLYDALHEINKKKLGMTVIYNNEMKISGIFTDGDLRRVFNLNINVNNIKISNVMTPGGIQVSPDMLVTDALHLMNKHHITVLLVVKNTQLLGIVHIHDILCSIVI